MNLTIGDIDREITDGVADVLSGKGIDRAIKAARDREAFLAATRKAPSK